MERDDQARNMESEDANIMRGQAEIWKYMYGFLDSMALRCVLELRIPDIINSHGGPMTLAQIGSAISEASAAAEEASTPDIFCLARIMRFLVRRNIFTVHHPSNGSGSTDDNHDQALYGLSHLSRWLIFSDGDDDERNLGPMFLSQTHPRLMKPWHFLSRCIKEGGGGVAFDKAHGRNAFSLMSEDSEFAKVFNYGMECTSRIVVKAVLEEYRDGFSCLGSLVDVGGGTGAAMSEIVKSHPHIKGINFDLPHVVSTAPAYPGVSHVGGNMFDSIPNADAVFMKWTMHDWGDKDCVKILKNCRKAIPEKVGKVIIVDAILDPKGNGFFDDTGLVFDLLMLAHTKGGKERTEKEWNKILKEGGFPRYKIIKILAFPSIIEACLE